MAGRGLFLTFEGGEGTGKGTQIRLLQEAMDRRGIPYLLLREPGGTAIGEAVRKIILDPGFDEFSSIAELMLYAATRAQLLEERIIPALQSGVNVICDRFFDSTTAYQGYGRGLNLDDLAKLRSIVTQGLDPDLTICLDLRPAVALSRATKEGADRIEREALGFHNRVYDGYRTIATQEPGRFRLVSAEGTPEEVFGRVEQLVASFFSGW